MTSNGRATAQLVRRPGADLTGARFAVEFTDPRGKAVAGLEPRVDSSDPDVATVEFFPGAAGKYEITASLKADGKVSANQTAELRVRGGDFGTGAAESRPENLRAIATATGREYVDVERAADVASRVNRIERARWRGRSGGTSRCGSCVSWRR